MPLFRVVLELATPAEDCGGPDEAWVTNDLTMALEHRYLEVSVKSVQAWDNPQPEHPAEGPWEGTLADLGTTPPSLGFQTAVQILADACEQVGNPLDPKVQRAVTVVRLQGLRLQVARILADGENA